ncbi:hypothetical protein [Paenibacillus sp. 276b]|uniref:hypothetical protein n=1 Tax=Paenibacillus sp. 276b TaxID=1566277 RepID=UPI0008989568|nr:hypothetical protein [Paenibacillus sp. 276b]SEB27652.1 hypothetical protein SAMN03159332_6329 [Paenibacillus sp. 276b]
METTTIFMDDGIVQEVLCYLREHDIIPCTYQYKSSEVIDIEGSKKIRLNFSEWSYPFIEGRTVAQLVPDIFADMFISSGIPERNDSVKRQ